MSANKHMQIVFKRQGSPPVVLHATGEAKELPPPIVPNGIHEVIWHRPMFEENYAVRSIQPCDTSQLLSLAVGATPTRVKVYSTTPCTCGERMVLRYRRRDGKPFFGCKGFPACRNAMNVVVDSSSSFVEAPQESGKRKCRCVACTSGRTVYGFDDPSGDWDADEERLWRETFGD